eukprot:Nitzschia sp. Nitz4//scaffold178_size73299//57215//59215//NITZ4_005716-RA/size73299-processed-gene-0.16-mRNA-1//1//CDS//3329539173//3681//frame0
MVVRSSQGSVASAGSGTIDAPRKRRQFPKRLDKRRLTIQTTTLKAEQNEESSKQNTMASSKRPPQSPHSKVNKQRTSDSVPPKSSRPPMSPSSNHARTQPSSGSSEKGEPKTSAGRPPIVPGVPRSPSSSSVLSRARSRSKSLVSRAGSVISRSSSMMSGASSTRSSVSRASSRASSRAESMVSLEQSPTSNPNTNRQTFYVRVCLGYLTGIKIEALKKKKNVSNNLVVGYAALAKSGKRLVLSQPIGPGLEGRDQKSMRLYWGNRKGANQPPSSHVSKRRLHFSLKLEREVDQEHREEESLTSLMSYNPEVVKIVIGLKCGDEKFPLGIANLVINGNEVVDQKVDMSLRPINETSFEDIKQKQKIRLGLFGGSKKKDVITFKDHDQQYKLLGNATLRVRLDIKPGEPGENKAEVWGEGDDASYITNFSQGTSGSLSRGPAQANRSYHSDLEKEREQIRQMEIRNPHIISSDPMQNLQMEASNLPLKYIVVRRHHGTSSDGRSCASSLTMPSPTLCEALCMSLNIWGDTDPPEAPYAPKNRLASSFSFDDDQRMQGKPGNSETSRSSGSGSGTDYTRSTNPSVSTDEEPSRDSHVADETRTERTQRDRAVQGRKPAPRSFPKEEGSAAADTVDITVETYEDLKDAQATLLRYANKVGMKMDDLLDG